MHRQPEESDWKQYAKLVPVARERYLARVNAALVEVLQSEEGTPTDNFWDALDQIQKNKVILQNCLDPYSRSNMQCSLRLMLKHGMLEEKDLSEFTADLRENLLATRDI